MRPATSGLSGLTEAVRTFQDYVGLKLHFNDQFIWHRDFRFNHKEEQLLKRKDAYLFVRMTEQEPDREVRIQRFISAFKQDKNAWIGEIFDQDHTEFHKKRMRVINALQYNLRTDIDRLVLFMEDREIDVRKLLLPDGQSPYIIQNQGDIEGGVSDETLALLEKAFKFCSQPSNDPFWEEKAFMLSKYHYWLDVDRAFLKQQLSKLVGDKT